MMKPTDGIFVLPGELNDFKIELGVSCRKLTKLIEAGNLVVIQELYDPESLLELRQAVVNWSMHTPPHPNGASANVPRINFHRRDDGKYPSYLPHCFYQYAFGDWDSVENELSVSLKAVCLPLLALQNELAGTNFSLSTPNLRFKLINHPAGGGYLVKHSHPYQPQKVAFFLSLSRYGQDFNDGGVMFDSPLGPLVLTELFDIGNAVYFKYDQAHAVPPIDPQLPLNWSSQAGLWILSVELVESYPNSWPE